MARSVFFSFHYQADIWRVSQVRNSWLTKGKRTNKFLDSAAWESVKRKGDSSIKSWIDAQLERTSVTVILIGRETSSRKYVNYEIQKSYERGNGIIGIYIHGIKDQNGDTSEKGKNPLDNHINKSTKSFLGLFDYEDETPLSDIFPCYYWIDDCGRDNMTNWIEMAAKNVGR